LSPTNSTPLFQLGQLVQRQCGFVRNEYVLAFEIRCAGLDLRAFNGRQPRRCNGCFSATQSLQQFRFIGSHDEAGLDAKILGQLLNQVAVESGRASDIFHRLRAGCRFGQNDKFARLFEWYEFPLVAGTKKKRKNQKK